MCEGNPSQNLYWCYSFFKKNRLKLTYFSVHHNKERKTALWVFTPSCYDTHGKKWGGVGFIVARWLSAMPCCFTAHCMRLFWHKYKGSAALSKISVLSTQVAYYTLRQLYKGSGELKSFIYKLTEKPKQEHLHFLLYSNFKIATGTPDWKKGKETLNARKQGTSDMRK